jgi:hypothetical protein
VHESANLPVWERRRRSFNSSSLVSTLISLRTKGYFVAFNVISLDQLLYLTQLWFRFFVFVNGLVGM